MRALFIGLLLFIVAGVTYSFVLGFLGQ